MSFAAQIRDLEDRFSARAAADGDVYLPNFTPLEPVDAVLIGMEPSLGRWARTAEEARQKVDAGFRNFMWSPEDFILHHAARRSLCSPGWTYNITDISKGAMLVQKAPIDRRARYARWGDLLDEELRLIAKPGAHLIAIGQDVRDFLIRRGLGRNVTSIVHYSPLASAARNAEVLGREAAFREFSANLSIQDLIEVAGELMRGNSVPATVSADAIGRLRKATFSESRKKLAFIYSTVFSQIRTAQPVVSSG
jgi:hypothetical protein